MPDRKRHDDDMNALAQQWLDAHPYVDPGSLVDALLSYGSDRLGADRHETKPFPRFTPPAQPTRYRLRIDLAHAKPPIWRRIELPSGIRLDVLHEVIQAAFGWTNSHLHRFNLVEGLAPSGYEEIVTPFDIDEGDDGVLESTLRLDEVLGEGRNQLWYEYDFGDSWAHRIRLEKTHLGDDDGCRVLGGSRAAPPEDAGGIGFYHEMLDALEKPGGHDPYVLEAAHHYGLTLASAEEFDEREADRAVQRAAASFASHEWALANRDRLHPSLTAMFDRLGVDAQRYLSGFVADAQLTASVDVSDDDASRATAVIRTMLDAIGDDGIALTTAGYLPPSRVSALMAELDSEKRWFGKANREDQTYPIFQLRNIVVALGLARVYRKRLVLTKAGARLRSAPLELWRHVASKLPVEKGEFETDAAAATLLVIAAGEATSRASLERNVDLLTQMLGWQPAGPAAYFPSSLSFARETLNVLVWAGGGAFLTALNDLSEPLRRGGRDLARATLWRGGR